METEVRHFHLDDDLAAQIPLEAGDDAGHVAWEDLTPEMRLYASHKDCTMRELGPRNSIRVHVERDKRRARVRRPYNE